MPKAWEGFFVTADWVIYAVALTLVFLVFIMRAYTIPTGSMADTLRGAHFRIRCTQCGYRYDYDFLRPAYGITNQGTPSVEVPIKPGNPQCPSCGFYHQTARQDPYGNLYYPEELHSPIISGDRIFVYKCLYQFFEPKRWDVIVFNPPMDPKINYIKRLVALPGETVQIIDGDVYIDNMIARKPGRVQNELWMPVFDNDYQPSRPEIPAFNGHVWSQPFANTEGSRWDLTQNGGTAFTLDGAAGKTDTITYDTNIGNDFRATYAYDSAKIMGPRDIIAICSDLRISFNVDIENDSIIGAELTKFGVKYRGAVDSTGVMIIGKSSGESGPDLLAETNIEVTRGIKNFSFTNVDHELIVKYDDQELRYDLGQGRTDAGEIIQQMPSVSIFGSGSLKLSHIKIDKDKYYYNRLRGRDVLRAGASSPFGLNDDEFFVLGDNSPASLDSRLWDVPGKGNAGHLYREGVVPRDYLIGKAFVVFWPGGQQIYDGAKVKLLPYVGGLKAIVGGAY
ncbi:MAG: signal peptidase I [Planctomycetes bacterium]|nr:signal peptidase I [Planctomycetota bacterium]